VLCECEFICIAGCCIKGLGSTRAKYVLNGIRPFCIPPTNIYPEDGHGLYFTSAIFDSSRTLFTNCFTFRLPCKDGSLCLVLSASGCRSWVLFTNMHACLGSSHLSQTAVSSHTWTHQLASCLSRWPPGAIYKTKIGGRSFRVAAPTVWNSLPLHLHNAAISERQFKLALKTHLFNLAYKWHLSSENYWRVNLLTYLLGDRQCIVKQALWSHEPRHLGTRVRLVM